MSKPLNITAYFWSIGHLSSAGTHRLTLAQLGKQDQIYVGEKL
jgi:hypothetical protein